MKKIQAIKLINREGFTLVELMVTVLLFSGIIALIYSTLVLGNYSWQVSRNNIFLQQEARRALISMVKELRSAENVSVSQSDQIDFSVDGIGDIQYTLESNQITRKDPTTG
ncbi:MAG: prepilin-type N-terminal cleavage/methylation domain-containing protein, partial [Candidatus Omnitrophica bacterium]|nr:prepilin-type N-terminal cleavage/methylation domain-containing protein [Candidatus Omnitrophota bacterium]